MEDVAKEARVSVATVSRVINRHSYVKDEVRNRVLKAIEKLEYQPNQIARGLASRKTNLIGVVVPDLKYHYYANMLSSMEEYASRHHYNIIVCNIKEDLDKELHYLNILREMWVDGIILMHEKIDEKIKKQLLECPIPIVLASIKLDGLSFSSVNIDDFKAAYDATEYLIKLGHDKIGIIAGDMRDYTAGYLRFEGYLKALKDYGIKFEKSYYLQGNFNIQDGYDAMGEFLQMETSPTAIFAVSDSMAVGAMNCAVDRGYRIPDDISILGFDNIDLAGAVRPRLTTINQPAEKIGSLAMELLIEYVEGKCAETQKEIVLEHSLMVGGTCKKIK